MLHRDWTCIAYMQPTVPIAEDPLLSEVDTPGSDQYVSVPGVADSGEGLWIAVFWLQLVQILNATLSSNYQVRSTTSSSTSTTSSWLSFGVLEEILSFRPFAFECVWKSFDFAARFWSLMVATCVLAFVLLLHRCHCFRYARKYIVVEFLQYLLSIVYFPSVLTILQVMPCQSQSSFSYLSAAPYVACGSAQHTAMVCYNGL